MQAALCAHSMTEDDLRALVLRRRVARRVALPPRSTVIRLPLARAATRREEMA